MGGFFSPQQQPTQVISPIPAEFGPFAQELIQAVANLFTQPGQGVTPLERATIEGAFQQAVPAQQLLDYTLRGGFLPGTTGAEANPFVGALMQGLEAQGELARRQWASQAQRAGALSGTDYLQGAAALESALAQKRGELLSGLYEQERARQMGAIPALQGLGQSLLGLASIPREVATEHARWPFGLGTTLVTAGRGEVIPGKTGPSPFAEMLGGLAPWAKFFIH